MCGVGPRPTADLARVVRESPRRIALRPFNGSADSSREFREPSVLGHLATPKPKVSRSTGCAFPSLEQSELHKKEPRRSGAPRLYDYRLGPPLGAGWFLLEPEPEDELGDALWFALG